MKLNKTTTIMPDRGRGGRQKDTTMTGAIVDVQPGSGLIKRCPDPIGPLNKGRASTMASRRASTTSGSRQCWTMARSHRTSS